MPLSSDPKGPDTQGPPKVVILGGGYGGVYTALQLQKAARRGRIDLSLVSQENFFLSQPMLAEVVSGSIEPPHIVNPIRRLLPHVHFHQAEVESVEPNTRNVVINYRGDSTQYNRIPYDHLVIAVGSTTDLSSLPGMEEHAFPFKTVGDAFFLRNHVISALEQAEVETDPDQKAELLTFVVAGGGYTGVEVAAEINAFTREAVKSYSRIDSKEITVILLHAGSRILPVLPDKLADFSHRELESQGLKIRLGASLKGATAQRAILSDGSTISTRTLVAAIGSAPNPVLSKIPIPKGDRGRVDTHETLAVRDHSGIWAVGDCAAVPDVRNDGTCPPTAQYAMRQAKHVARNILASINGESVRPFSSRNLGVFVPLGGRSAAANIMGLNLRGLLAWWLYRTFYLYQLPRLERKIRVMTDWTLELFFRRDIVHMDIARSKGISKAHFEAGEMIFHEGELARNFYTILEGSVQVIHQDQGQETLLATLGRGEFFGEMALLQGVRRTASIRALTPTDLLVMGGSDFQALATKTTYFGETLTEVIRQRQSMNTGPGYATTSGPGPL